MRRNQTKKPIATAIQQSADDSPIVLTRTKLTLRNFDMRSLTPVKPLSPRHITAIRRREKVSPVSFAYHLGVSVTLVSQWERGEKKPSGPSLKLLTLVKNKGLDYVA